MISCGQDITQNGLTLGPLPSGVEASLVTNESENSLQLVVTEVETIVQVNELNVIRGRLQSGSLEQLFASDNERVQVTRDTSQIQSEIIIEVNSFLAIQSPSSLSLVFEGNVFARTAISQSIELLNFSSGTFEEVDTSSASRFIDRVTIAPTDGNLTRFIESGSGQVIARIRFKAGSNRPQFAANLDQIEFRLQE